MYGPNKDFDLFEFIFGNADIYQWISSYLTDYIKDTIMQALYQQDPSTQQWDSDKLNEYVREIIGQSLGFNKKPTESQAENIDDTNSMNGQPPNEIHQCITSVDESLIDTGPAIKATIQEQAESFSPSNEMRNTEPQSDSEKPETKEQMVIPNSNYIDKNIGIQPQIIQTHSMVIIRIELPEGINENDLKISINDDHTVIKWPFGYLEQIIPLPADIQQSSSSAIIKDRVLEIQINRRYEGEIRQVNL